MRSRSRTDVRPGGRARRFVAPDPVPIVGDIVADRYRIDAVLGFGGMASVFRATDLRLDRDVAIKVLAANLAADPAFAERFDREARTMAGFSHPSLVAVYDVEPGDRLTGREPLYVMEYCPEGSLADRLTAGGSIPAEDLVPAIGAVAEGLEELHAAGFIHRDVKPHNILFAGGRAKLGHRELGQLAGSVRTAVQRNDLGAATTAASTLADRARALSGGLEADRRQPLLDAVAALGKAL